MARRLKDWLQSYVEYTSNTEAPKIVHLWAGIGALAGALRRKVWFDQVYFRWYPSFYIIFVGPPGVITKSTTAENSMKLLRAVPGIHFGPDEVTWQSLITSFANSCESFMLGDEIYPMSAITLVSSEFGILMDFEDKKMVNIFISLWDGLKKFEKETKTSGNDLVEAPWINMLACTTPQWIAENMNASTVGGGFTSRCIFVYGDKKEQYIANIKKRIKELRVDVKKQEEDLIHDLEHISLNLVGEYNLDAEAEAWYDEWYEHLWTKEYSAEKTDFENGQVARRQTHLTKLAMVLAAAQRDELVITKGDLQLADLMLKDVAASAHKVFQKIGRSDDSLQAERALELVRMKGKVRYEEIFKMLYIKFSDARTVEGIITGGIKAGLVQLQQTEAGAFLVWVGGGA